MPQPVLSSTSTSKHIDVPNGFFLGIAGSLIGVLGLHWAVIYCQLGVPTRTSGWAYEINLKKLQRAASIQKPKLLLVGGSGTLFGIRAELIETELAYPTVNLGTHAALGGAYMLHLAKQAAKPGDTVLLAFEYESYRFADVRPDVLFADYLLARDPVYFRALPLSSQFKIGMSLTSRRMRRGIRNRLRPEAAATARSVYDSAKLNPYGDQLGNEAANRPANLARLRGRDIALVSGFPEIPPAFARIEEFVRWARTNAVRVIATYPNVMEHSLYRTQVARKSFEQIRNAYERLGVPIIGTPEGSMMPPWAFYDTFYHLTDEGAAARTERLIPHLAAVLKQ